MKTIATFGTVADPADIQSIQAAQIHFDASARLAGYEPVGAVEVNIVTTFEGEPIRAYLEGDVLIDQGRQGV